MPPHFPQGIDSTMLSAFRNCPQQFFHSFCLDLHSKTPSADLLAGGALAAGLEAARRAFLVEHVPHNEALARGLIVLTRYYGDYDPISPKRNKAWDRIASAYVSYFDHYGTLDTDPFRPLVHTASGQPGCEFSFAVPLPYAHPVTGDPLLFTGRIDLVGEYHGLPSFCDEKTTSSFSSNWSEKWNLRGQFLGYFWALTQYGIPAEQCLVRGIGLLVNSINFLPALLPRQNWLIAQWEEELYATIERMLAQWERHINSGVSFSRVFNDACDAYGGCQFRPLCAARNPEAWYNLYSRRRWDPLHKDPLHTESLVQGAPV